MNKRIRELAEQATDVIEIVNPDTGITHTREFFDKEKFAELIVKECLKELRYEVLDTQECRQDKSTDYQVGWEDGMFEAGETIKQHFGVE